jgi:hypothetical protein
MCLPVGGRFDGKIVLRKPIDEKEDGKAKKEKPSA